MRVIAGKIELLEKIAAGGMAEVFRGRNRETGANVAVKLLPPSAAATARERFRLEARLAATVAHRGIVRVFDLLEDDDGTLALVMELLTGETAESRFARGAVDPDEAVAMVLPILGALEHAHAVGMVHRDVKPANVFLAVEPDGVVTPKLLDFGVAKAATSSVQTMDGSVLGTARYMSPEQIRGEPLDGRSDVFSVAVLLYEAIVGESPFASGDAAASIAKILEQSVDPHERIPPRLWLVIERALAKQRYARPESAAAFARELVATTGQTSDDLGALLTATPPSVPRLETRGDPRPVAVPARFAAGRFRVQHVLLGGLMIVGAVAITAALLAPASPTIDAAHSSASAVPLPVAAPSDVAPTASAPPSPSPPSSDSVAPPSVTSAPTPHRALPSRPSPPRKKDLATTPGF